MSGRGYKIGQVIGIIVGCIGGTLIIDYLLVSRIKVVG